MELVGRLCRILYPTEVKVGTNYIKNGPGKNDFAATEMKIQPSGSVHIPILSQWQYCMTESPSVRDLCFV